MKLYINYYS